MHAVDWLGPQSPLGNLLVGYENRPGQLAMAARVERALAEGRTLFVEAGTGTGKTLAYLVPAVLSGRKVVVSTATRALQEQIFAKDLPLVRSLLEPLGVGFRAALMKGLPNYVCRRRLAEALSAGSAPNLVRIERWARESDSGDRAELASVPEDAEVWKDVLSSTETRIGSGCSYFDDCFVTRMRKEAEEASLVVVNHHLFFADLALRRTRNDGYASALPAYDAVIFDEAHQIENVATEFFGTRVSTTRFEALVRDAERAVLAAGTGRSTDGGVSAILRAVERDARAFFAAVSAKKPPGSGERRVLSSEDWSGEALSAHDTLDASLEVLHQFGASERDESLVSVGRRARELKTDLREIVLGSKKLAGQDDERYEDGAARVSWLEVRERSVGIGASPIDLGPTLRQALFDRIPSVVCTSATLTTASPGGSPSFHFARARLGAPLEAEELVVESPFDFASRAALYVARDLPEPASPSYEALAVERIVELVSVTGGGAFVLCTSNRAMNGFARGLRSRLRVPLFVQGQAPKQALLSRFRASGDAVLVATMSFWEGVDVPGRALRLVVLDKAPFAVPTDPVVSARCTRIDREGGNAFMEYSVPEAALTLKQGFGRLIRTRRDAGIVAILDSRLAKKAYGRRLVGSLPPARRVETLEELATFWANVDATVASAGTSVLDDDGRMGQLPLPVQPESW